MYCSKKLNFAALGALVTVLAGCGGGEKHEVKKPENLPAISASVVQAKEETVPDSYEATGTVKARVTSVLSARIMGYIREIRAQVGDSVKAGQVIAVIDAKEVETGMRQAEAARNEARGAMPEVTNAIAAAQAQLDLAESTYQRMKTLLDQKSITNQEFDEVAARRRMAQANLEMARAKRVQLEQKIRQSDEGVAQAGLLKGYTEVLAPFAGTVIERKAEAGMLAAPGMPLLVLEQAGGYRLEAGVDESRIKSIRPGMPVQVQLEAAEQPQDARVEEIVPTLDAGSRTFTVKIGLRGGLLRSGMFGRARFSAGDKKALTVPASSLIKQGQVEKVFVVEGGTARGRLITTGLARGGAVEVLSGLKAGESVVAPVPAALQDGSRIEVRQ